MLLILGLPEDRKLDLMSLGYTEEDIAEFMDWILHYNDYNHHIITGFSPEEMERFYAAGLTDAQISELQAFVNNYYAQLHSAQEVVKQQQTELMQVQVSLSLAALKLLENENHDKSKNKDKNPDRLQNTEEKLLQTILNVSEDQPSLEKVKASSKQVYKAAEQKIRKGETQYFVDFFTGLQIYCGAVTALNGDAECGLAQITHYKNIVSECAESPERPILQFTQTVKQQAILKHPVLVSDFTGQVEESNEANNMGVITVFVKAPDTTFLQFLMLLFAGVGAEAWFNWTLPDLTLSLESLFAGGVTVSSIAAGAVGAVILLVVTIPPVGYEEWPDAVPGYIEGKEVIIIVDGSYGQGHIQKKAQSSEEPCTRSSHQAIIDDKYMIGDIVRNAEKLLYHPGANQYLYYYKSFLNEWAVIIEEWGSYGIYELITAFRADCPLPEECKKGDDMVPVHSYLDVLDCQGFKLISIL